VLLLVLATVLMPEILFLWGLTYQTFLRSSSPAFRVRVFELARWIAPALCKV
jgi:hypothetical protein